MFAFEYSSELMLKFRVFIVGFFRDMYSKLNALFEKLTNYFNF